MFTKRVFIPIFMFVVLIAAANVSYSQDTQKQSDPNVTLVPPGSTVNNNDATGTNQNDGMVGYAFDEKTVLAVDDGKNIGKGKNGITPEKNNNEGTNTNTSTDVNDNR